MDGVYIDFRPCFTKKHEQDMFFLCSQENVGLCCQPRREHKVLIVFDRVEFDSLQLIRKNDKSV